VFTADNVSRPMWEAVERFHGLVYLAPEPRTEATTAGLKGFWMNYFASRVAPLGAVSAAAVSSTFFYYGPSRVHRAIPDAWSFATPTDIIDARYRGMRQALARVYGSTGRDAEIAEAASLVRRATEGATPIGRLLFAGWNSLEWPAEPHLALWHGCTLLREYRSGNHLIALCAEGLSGCESIVSHVAVDAAPSEWIHDEAGWTKADSQAAVASLQERGWLDASGAATAACHEGRARIEAMTDALDFGVWQHLGENGGSRLFDLLADLASLLPPDDQLDWRKIYESDV